MVKQKVMEDLARLPNYVCTETLDQSRRPGRCASAQASGTPDPSCRFENFNRVPPHSSTWVLRHVWGNAITGYCGSLWIDRQTLDPVELNMTADDVPASFGLKAVHRELWYKRAAVGSHDVLLPEVAIVLTADLDGNETRSDARFHSCREYRAESAIHYGPQAETPAEERPSVRRLSLPDAFETELELENDIDSDTAAVGDAVTARLRRNVRHGRAVVIPKSAILAGRITRLDVVEDRRYLDIAFHEVDIHGNRVDIRNRRNELVSKHGQSEMLGAIRLPESHIQLPEGHRLLIRSTTRSQ